MNDTGNYMLECVRYYLANRMDTEAFRQSFASAYHYTRSRAAHDQQARSLANSLIGPFAEFSAGHRSEESLRRELANAIRPFEEQHRVLQFDGNGNAVATKTAASTEEVPIVLLWTEPPSRTSFSVGSFLRSDFSLAGV
jgi:hypothetical protein